MSEVFAYRRFQGSGGAEHLLPEKKDVFSGKQNDYSFAVRKQRIYRTEKQNPGGAGTGLQTDPKEEFSLAKATILECIDLLIQETSPVALIEEEINEILVFLSHVPGNAGGDIDFNILFHDFKSRDYLLAYRTEEELKTSLKNLVYNLFEAVQKRIPPM